MRVTGRERGGDFGVVQEEPVGQLLVEGFKVSPVQGFVGVNERLLHSAMDTLDQPAERSLPRLGVTAS